MQRTAVSTELAASKVGAYFVQASYKDVGQGHNLLLKVKHIHLCTFYASHVSYRLQVEIVMLSRQVSAFFSNTVHIHALYVESSMVGLVPGHGIGLTKRQLDAAHTNAPTVSRLIRNLMGIIFTPEKLAVSSACGN